MPTSYSVYHPALVELARAGSFRAIAGWLNQALGLYGMQVYVGHVRPGYLRILIELERSPTGRQLAGPWRDPLVRYVCYQIWRLNSALIEGAKIATRFAGERRILWERSVRIVSPARKQRQVQSQHLKLQVRQTARQHTQLRTLRTALMSSSTIVAFIFGGVLAYTRSPVEQGSATSSAPGTTVPVVSRPNTVQGATELLTVVEHRDVRNPNDPTVTMLFAGDVTLGEVYEERFGHDPAWGFARMDESRAVDLSMVNLENPLTRATLPLPNKQFNFRADPKMVQVLAEGGVDLVTLANNHTMDYQKAGLVETMDTLDQAGILHMGAGEDLQAARRPRIVDVKGQRIAFLAYYGELHAAGPETAGTNSIDEAKIAQDIRSLRSQVDWIVVNYHWGIEKATEPAAWQRDLAHFTIDQGADVVVGHHPHVLQGGEIYKGRPIAYSLGNFIFGGNARSDYDTAVLRVAVKDHQMKVEFLPVEVRDYQPQVVSGDRGTSILQTIEARSAHFEQPLPMALVLDAQPRPTAAPATETATPAEEAVPESQHQVEPSELTPPAAVPAPTEGFTDAPQHTPFTQPDPAPAPESSETEPAPAARQPQASRAAIEMPQLNLQQALAAVGRQPQVQRRFWGNDGLSLPEFRKPAAAIAPDRQPPTPTPDVAPSPTAPPAPTAAPSSPEPIARKPRKRPPQAPPAEPLEPNVALMGVPMW